MAVDITLDSASRANLLALQNTQAGINQTNERLSTGLEVGSPIDDPVKYFQAKALSDRAADLSARKDKIDQGVSALKVTTDATSSITSLINNMKGLLDAARGQNSTQLKSTETQVAQLIGQIQKLVNDASYQGLNLLNSSTASLTVYFSEKTDSKLNVQGVNILSSQLYIKASNSSALGVKASTIGANFSAMSQASALLNQMGFTQALSKYTISLVSLQNKLNSSINTVMQRMDTTINAVNAKAATFGTDVSILQNRLDFTNKYINDLSDGAGKLTLADTNTEGANLLALQTRQQLGIRTLSFAGQSQQAVLRLFG